LGKAPKRRRRPCSLQHGADCSGDGGDVGGGGGGGGGGRDRGVIGGSGRGVIGGGGGGGGGGRDGRVISGSGGSGGSGGATKSARRSTVSTVPQLIEGAKIGVPNWRQFVHPVTEAVMYLSTPHA